MKQTTFPSYGIFCFYPFDCERLANLVDRCDDFFPRSQHHSTELEATELLELFTMAEPRPSWSFWDEMWIHGVILKTKNQPARCPAH